MCYPFLGTKFFLKKILFKWMKKMGKNGKWDEKGDE